MNKPNFEVIEGGRYELEREALRAIFWDVPKFQEIHQRLKKPQNNHLRIVPMGDKSYQNRVV